NWSALHTSAPSPAALRPSRSSPCAPTVCTHGPVPLISTPSHSQRNAGWRSGAQPPASADAARDVDVPAGASTISGLAIGLLLQVVRVTTAVHGYVGRGAVYRAQIIRRELHV